MRSLYSVTCIKIHEAILASKSEQPCAYFLRVERCLNDYVGTIIDFHGLQMSGYLLIYLFMFVLFSLKSQSASIADTDPNPRLELRKWFMYFVSDLYKTLCNFDNGL